MIDMRDTGTYQSQTHIADLVYAGECGAIAFLNKNEQGDLFIWVDTFEDLADEVLPTYIVVNVDATCLSEYLKGKVTLHQVLKSAPVFQVATNWKGQFDILPFSGDVGNIITEGTSFFDHDLCEDPEDREALKAYGLGE